MTQGLVTDFGLNTMTVTFKGGPKRVTRVILRTTRTGNEHLRTGEILLHAGSDSNIVPFEFLRIETCAIQPDGSRCRGE